MQRSDHGTERGCTLPQMRFGPPAEGEISAVYDRAALIALPPAMRRDYAHKMSALCVRDTAMLLITVAYDVDLISPPPFAVTAEEIGALYGNDWTIAVRNTREADVKGQPGTEQAFVLHRR